MPEQISGGMGFGSIRLNGQIVHFQGLHDVYTVNAISTSDTITLADKADVVNPVYDDLVGFKDAFEISAVQAAAIEVLASEGTNYDTTDTVTLSDTAAKT